MAASCPIEPLNSRTSSARETPRSCGLGVLVRRRVWVAVVFSLGISLQVGRCQAQAEEPSTESIRAWVEQLASGEFERRDQATSQLSRLGAEHLPILKAELDQATDPEVRVRLSGVIAKLKYERQQRVVRAFLRDPDMSNYHELEGWKSFSAISGANRSAKRLFLQLYERHPTLVEKELESGARAIEAARHVSRRIQEDEIHRGEGDRTDGLALLYCLCAADTLGDNQLATMSLRTFLRSPYNQLFRDPQAKKPMEVMVERWALSLEGGADLTSAILIMTESELSTVRSVARKMLENQEEEDQAEPDELLIALQMLFRYGTKEDLPVLERWLDNTEVCLESFAMQFPGGAQGLGGAPNMGVPPPGYGVPSGRPGGNPDPNLGRTSYTVEIRDAAVLACMQIAGMEYRDHFPDIILQEPRGYLARSIVSLSSDDEVRQARIAAWRASPFASQSLPKN
jgi:hypothetical protein